MLMSCTFIRCRLMSSEEFADVYPACAYECLCVTIWIADCFGTELHGKLAAECVTGENDAVRRAVGRAPVSGRGLRILTMDGGGMKGIATLRLIRQVHSAILECHVHSQPSSTSGLQASTGVSIYVVEATRPCCLCCPT